MSYCKLVSLIVDSRLPRHQGDRVTIMYLIRAEFGEKKKEEDLRVLRVLADGYLEVFASRGVVVCLEEGESCALKRSGRVVVWLCRSSELETQRHQPSSTGNLPLTNRGAYT